MKHDYLNLKMCLMLVLLVPMMSFAQPIDWKMQHNQLRFNGGIITYGSAQAGFGHYFQAKGRNQLGLGLSVGHWYNMDLFGFLKSTYGLKAECTLNYLRFKEKGAFDLETGFVLGYAIGDDIVQGNRWGITPNRVYRYHVFPKLQLGFRKYAKKKSVYFQCMFGIPETLRLGVGFAL